MRCGAMELLAAGGLKYLFWTREYQANRVAEVRRTTRNRQLLANTIFVDAHADISVRARHAWLRYVALNHNLDDL
jgi:hypothetical protein